jgi:DNA-binding beta-propeller fold protein YncE
VVHVAPQPEQIAILPDSSKAFISSGDSDRISVVELRKPALIVNLHLGGSAGSLVLKSDGGELYIPSPDAHGLLIVNTWTNEVSDYTLLGSAPTRAVLSPDDQFLYVADSAASEIVPIQINFRQVLNLDVVKTGQQPQTLEFTPVGGMLLVVDTASDDLAVIRTVGCSQPGSSAGCLIAMIPVGRGPRDLAIKQF